MKTLKTVILSLLLIALMAVGVWAEGQTEYEPDAPIVLVMGKGAVYAPSIAKFQETHDNELRFVLSDVSTGGDITMKVLLAAGAPPDIYLGWIGRVGGYMIADDNPNWTALDFSEYLDMSDWFNLDSVTRDGKVIGMLAPGSYQGMMVHLDLLASIGEADFDFEGWTIDDFLAMGAKMRTKHPDKYLTGFFAGNMSGDYILRNYFASFNAEFFADGYESTTINSPGGLATIEFFAELYEKGYIPVESGLLVDDDYVLQMARSEFLFAPAFTGWVTSYVATVSKQTGKDVSFPYRFVAFPTVDGHPCPTFGSSNLLVAKKTSDRKRNQLIADLANLLLSAEVQTGYCANDLAAAPTRAGVITNSDEHTEAIAKIVAEGGVYDLGLSTINYAGLRAVLPPLLQDMFAGKMSPREVLDAYEVGLNEVLAARPE